MQTVVVSDKPWGAEVRMTKPPVNAMSVQLVSDLVTAFTQLIEQQPTVVVLTGDGKCFSAGADLKERHTTPDSILHRFATGRKVLDLLREAPFPTIAAVNGACMGAAMNVIANCDLRVAHEAALFGLPEIKLGRAGGAGNLRGVLGEGAIRWIALTGDQLDATQALQASLVQRVIPASSWDDDVDALAARIARAGSTGLYAIKESLRKTRVAPLQEANWIEQQISFRMWSAGLQQSWADDTQASAGNGIRP